MLKTVVIAFATFFATIGPLDLAALFAALTPCLSDERRKATTVKGTLAAACILLFFAVFGTALLDYLGISLAALRISGGILLLLFAIDMVFGDQTTLHRSSEDERTEAMQKSDLSVFPLAMPLIAGPATIGATIVLMAATQVRKLLGVTGLHVVTRIAGVILCALAVQFIIDGLRESMLFMPY
jgi:multiple antibiotic resistance protein